MDEEKQLELVMQFLEITKRHCTGENPSELIDQALTFIQLTGDISLMQVTFENMVRLDKVINDKRFELLTLETLNGTDPNSVKGRALLICVRKEIAEANARTAIRLEEIRTNYPEDYEAAIRLFVSLLKVGWEKMETTILLILGKNKKFERMWDLLCEYPGTIYD